jgi:predicted nucleic acid-binding protein
MTFVVDASVALAWSFDDERTEGTDSLLRLAERTSAWVPAIWHLEVANGLQLAVGCGRINAAFRDGVLTDLRALGLHTDPETISRAWKDTLLVSERYALTVYDACYLELAQRRSLPLATLDRALRKAAENAGVSLARADG